MAPRGKVIALWSAGLGSLVLLGGAVVLREPLLEEWHIHKLRTGDVEEARRAAGALGRMGSVRAVPALLEAPGRTGKEPPAAKGARRVSIHRPVDIGGKPALPFPAADGADWQMDWQTALRVTGRAGGQITWDARTGNMVMSMNDGPGVEEALDILRWASDAIARIGERAVPALERAAADQSLDPGARAFASFELARRALASPRIVLAGESAEVSVEQRTSAALPGSRGSVYVSASDIKRGKVQVWITPSTGAPLVEEHMLAEGEEVSFTLQGKTYILRLVDLRNRLIGTDHAVFKVREKRLE